MIETIITLKEMTILPELFLGVSVLYAFLYGIFLAYTSNKYPLIQNAISYLGVLILILVFFLLITDRLIYEQSSFSNTIIFDYLSLSSKIIICFFSLFSLIMIRQYLTDQKLNYFEYVIILLLSILGLFFICSANDLITAYLAIELQTLAFYTLAAFKRNSTFSVEAGLKYFVLGSLSSGLFLYGSSFIYGITGSTNFEDFKNLLFWAVPGSIFYMNLEEYINLLSEDDSFRIFSKNLENSIESGKPLTKQDFLIMVKEYFNQKESGETATRRMYYSLLTEFMQNNELKITENSYNSNDASVIEYNNDMTLLSQFLNEAKEKDSLTFAELFVLMNTPADSIESFYDTMKEINK